ncbi:MAG: hypothetical protein H2184_15800 [Candidatus Galacturonibacter soehngenii]|nr:hypothetical protein [Candidatus Galacturonibacter soehngenii]
MDNYNELIKNMGITFENNIVDDTDFEHSIELPSIQELLDIQKKGCFQDGKK